jgi:guanylate kinase
MKNVLVIAGPTGTGKDSILKGVLERVSNANFLVNATTRKPRKEESYGKSYYFFDNETFLLELKNGNIIEYYHRPETDTYYGTYKTDLLSKIENRGIAITQVQIVGAKKLKEDFNATTVFILPESLELLEKRVRARNDISDNEWQERKKHTEREMSEDVNFYDYKVVNKEGKLEESIEEVLKIMKKEGFDLILK